MSRIFTNQENKVSESPASSYKLNSSVYDDLTQAIEHRNVDTISHILNCSYDLTIAEKGCAKNLLHAAFKNTDCDLELQPLIIGTLKLLLDRGVDVNVKDNKERTVLHLAVENRMTKVIDFLLDRQADLHVHDGSGNSLLHFLIEAEIRKFSGWDPRFSCSVTQERPRRSMEFIEWMILKGLNQNVDCQNEDGDTAVHLAAAHNLLHALPIRLKHAKDLKICNSYKKNAFEIFAETNITRPFCARKSHDQTTSRVIQNDDGVVVDTITTISYHSDFVDEIFMRFLQRGFTINDVDNCGNTPVHYALKLSRPMIAKSMLNEFTSLNVRNVDGNTVLHIAVDQLCRESYESPEYCEIVHLLLAEGADINITNKMGFSPLNIVMKERWIIHKKEFIDCVTSCDQRYKENLLFYFFKTKIENNIESDEAVIDLLISQGWGINAKDTRGMTLLHVASQLFEQLGCRKERAFNGNRNNTVDHLIRRGARVDIMNNDGFLPLHVAVVHHDSEVVKELLKFGSLIAISIPAIHHLQIQARYDIP